MKRRAFLISLWATVVAGVLLFTHFFNPSTPQLRLLGFTNSTGGSPMAMLCFSNSTHHAVYLTGPTTGSPSPFFGREVKTADGWQAADAPVKHMTNYSWEVTPGQTCVFNVPALSNQPGGWRVTVRYFDGAVFTELPVLRLSIRLPSKGSGRYLDVSTDPITQKP